MFPSLVQSKYAAAKDIVFGGIRYVQEHASPSFRAWHQIPYFVYAMVGEYKVKERCISLMSDPYSNFSMFWEMGLTYLDTPVKQVFVIQLVLGVVLAMLNYFFARLQRYYIYCFFNM